MTAKKKQPLAAIILAAGQGTRMKSEKPKVLHPVCGRPMLDHVLEALAPLKLARTIVVTGHKADEVEAHVGKRGECVLQRERLGTGHAVKVAAAALKGFEGDVMILVGDAPLFRPATLEQLAARRRELGAACVVLTTEMPDPTGYGRIVRNRDGSVNKIVEQKDANIYEEQITEINTGTYCFEASELFRALSQLKDNNAQQEYYLTDTVQILREKGQAVEALVCEDNREVIGVNSRKDLATAEGYLRERILDAVMDSGVTVLDPSTTRVDASVRIGAETTLHPFTIIEGETKIGKGAQIGPHATVRDSEIGDATTVTHAMVVGARVGMDSQVGPYAVLGPGAQLRSGERAEPFQQFGEPIGGFWTPRPAEDPKPRRPRRGGGRRGSGRR